MPNLNTTQLAHDFLGPASRRVYHQDLTTNVNQPHLKIDKMGAGDFGILKSAIPTSYPDPVYQADGLFFSLERPANTSGTTGLLARVNLQQPGTKVPARFVLTSTFQAPKIISLNSQPPYGTFAASLLLNVNGTFMGATSQFRLDPTLPSGMRLNLPGTGVMANRPYLMPDFNEVSDPQNPPPFTIVLCVDILSSGSTGKASLFIEDRKTDELSFNFPVTFNSTNNIDYFQTGLGTANGSSYRASIFLLEFEVWAPTPNQ